MIFTHVFVCFYLNTLRIYPSPCSANFAQSNPEDPHGVGKKKEMHEGKRVSDVTREPLFVLGTGTQVIFRLGCCSDTLPGTGQL